MGTEPNADMSLPGSKQKWNINFQNPRLEKTKHNPKNKKKREREKNKQKTNDS